MSAEIHVPRDASASPPEAWEPLFRMARLARKPLERFLRIEAASGLALLAAAVMALLLANSPWGAGYQAFWHTPVGFRLGSLDLERSLEWLVNDGLMVIFFFVVGMEIRRELHHGELSAWKRAALPVAAALGGMLVPAGLFLAVAGGPQTRGGWGVPMATDIAFALGVLAVLGPRVPAAVRVLLLALAVIDDLGAILVIALVYSGGIGLAGLAVAAAGLGGILALQRVGVRAWGAYVLPGVVVWAGVYAAGVHPTVAGVLIGLLTPVRTWLGPEGFAAGVRRELAQLSEAGQAGPSSHDLARALRHVDAARREAMSPAENLIEALHPWVAFFIMPVFAAANAAVSLESVELAGVGLSVTAGVGVGLVLGKPLGILLACWLALRTGLGALPAGVGWRHLLVLGMVGGVGFTMSLFIAPLAFTDPQLLGATKLGVLVASGTAAVLALGVGWLFLRADSPPGATPSADQAEGPATA